MLNTVRHVAQGYRKVEVLAGMTFELFVQSRVLVSSQHRLAKNDHRPLFDGGLQQFRLGCHLVLSISNRGGLTHLE